MYKKIKVIALLSSLLIVSSVVYAIERDYPLENTESAQNSRTHYVVLPAQNGGGGERYVKDRVLNTAIKDNKELWIYFGRKVLDDTTTVNKYDYLTQWSRVDLGQGNCVNHFLEQFQQDEDVNKCDNIVMTGMAQGTATILNSLKKIPAKNLQKIKLILLESVLGTPNSAIIHTCYACISSKLTYIPFSRAWIPAIGKILFPSFNPLWGATSLKSAKNVPDNVPVVIMHDTKDFQLSINDSRRLYLELIKNNKEAYLFETVSSRGSHLNILSEIKDKTEALEYKAALQQIYKNNNLPFDEQLLKDKEVIDLSKFQPTEQVVQAKIAKDTSNFYRNLVDGVSILGLGIFAYYKWGKNWF